jgi:hypothetical protein
MNVATCKHCGEVIGLWRFYEKADGVSENVGVWMHAPDDGPDAYQSCCCKCDACMSAATLDIHHPCPADCCDGKLAEPCAEVNGVSETKHTLGPWASCNFRVTSNPANGLRRYICDTANNRATRTPENEANARLIAAAPELLEALITLSDCASIPLQSHMPDCDFCKADKLAEAAIRKAKGE